MKKSTLIIFLFIISISSAIGQTSKDKIQIGSEFSLNTHILSDFLKMNIKPSMTGGYFITDHILV